MEEPVGTPGMDYSVLTSAIDATTLATAILAVGAVLVGPRLARMGVKWISARIG